MNGYLYIALNILLTVYGQIGYKMQMLQSGPLPDEFLARVGFLLIQLLHPWAFSALLAGFLAALCWMAAMAKFELSTAYPFTALSFVLLPLLSRLIFHDSFTPLKITGILLITVGVAMVGRG